MPYNSMSCPGTNLTVYSPAPVAGAGGLLFLAVVATTSPPWPPRRASSNAATSCSNAGGSGPPSFATATNVAQGVGRFQQEFDQGRGGHDLVVAHAVQQALQAVREGSDVGEPEGAAGALDGMGRSEDAIQQLRRRRAFVPRRAAIPP